MAKGSGGTKYQGASSASAKNNTLGGGSGVARGNTFSAGATLNQFEGDTSVGGGYYSLMTKDGKYQMVIETENGYSNEQGIEGTMVSVGIRKGTGAIENLTGFYANSDSVANSVNKSMPYLAELANKWIKKNK